MAYFSSFFLDSLMLCCDIETNRINDHSQEPINWVKATEGVGSYNFPGVLCFVSCVLFCFFFRGGDRSFAVEYFQSVLAPILAQRLWRDREHMFHIDSRLHTFLHPLSHLIRAWKGKWT